MTSIPKNTQTASVSNNISEQYENIITKYLNGGYCIVNQTNNSTEMRKKSGISKYVIRLLLYPFIAEIVGQILTKHPRDFFINCITIPSIVFCIGLFTLIAGRNKNNVFIRITKTGTLDITGYTLEKNNKIDKNSNFIKIICIAFLLFFILPFPSIIRYVSLGIVVFIAISYVKNK